MGDLERTEIYGEISETLDNLDEILEDHEVDRSEDDEFAEIIDAVERIRSIVNKE